MTALAAAPAAAVRPIPWQRLAWVVARRYRSTLFGLGALAGTLAAYLLVTGLQTRAAYDKVAECRPPARPEAMSGWAASASASCQVRWMDFINGHAQHGLIGPVMLLLPGLVGAFVGAQVLGRELESGVFRYTWTQGVGRMRWALAMVVPAAVLVVVVVGGLGLLVSWRNEPLDDAGVSQRLEPSYFPTTGVAVVGWALLAFAGGVIAGLLWRRVIPAIASTFAVWFGLAYVASVLRPHVLAPLTTTDELRGSDLELSTWWTHGGSRVSMSEINSVLEKIGVTASSDGMQAEARPGARGADAPDPYDYLARHGYSLVHSYQPDSRYWPLQWIELGFLVVLSAVVLAVAFWLLRRRSA